MNRFLSAFLLSTSMFAAACAAEAVDGGAGSGTPERGIGKADGLFGSCFDEGEATCDGPAAEGNCWCDESCTDFGDCCSDKAEACGGEEPPPQPQLCMSDDACDDGQICDHSECLSGCSTDEVCPAVCFGQCVDEEPEPECGAPEEYVDVDPAELFANPEAFAGQKIALSGSARPGFPICTQQACFADNPCCNSCGAGIDMMTDAGELEMSGLGCGGNNCDVMANCDYGLGQEFVAWGTMGDSFGIVHLEVDGHCSPEEPEEPEEPECDCEEGEVCVPLCPVCAAGTPPEDCQCTSTCVDQFPGIDFPGAACFNQCMAGCDDAGTGACAQMCNEQCEQ